MIRGIFFDAAGVLYDRPEPTGTYVTRLLSERGLSPRLSMENQMRQKKLRARARIGHLDADSYWDQVLLMHGITDLEDRRALAVQIDSYSDQVLPIAGVHEALGGLEQRGFVLGVITDTIYQIDRKKRWLDAIGVTKFIDVLACSTALGVSKPDPAIYLSALQQADLTPGVSAFVGHAADELGGARRVGLATVAVYGEPGARADYYAESLVALLDVPIFSRSGTEEAGDE